jgi:hypothetical protein
MPTRPSLAKLSCALARARAITARGAAVRSRIHAWSAVLHPAVHSALQGSASARPVDWPVSKECSGTNAGLPMSTPSFANRFPRSAPRPARTIHTRASRRILSPAAVCRSNEVDAARVSGMGLPLHARLSHKPPAFRSIRREKKGHAPELPHLGPGFTGSTTRATEAQRGAVRTARRELRAFAPTNPPGRGLRTIKT